MQRSIIGRSRAHLRGWPLALAILAQAGGSAAATEPFDVADIFFELNSTDGDVGVHVSLDASSWRYLRILDPRGREVIEVEPEGSAERIGLTELFFEGEEPSLKKVPFARFLRLFPPGRYRFEAHTVEGGRLRSRDRLSAQLPCPVEVTSPRPSGPVAPDSLVVRWRTVPGVYNPDTRVCQSASDVGLIGYQVIVEYSDEATGVTRDFVAELPPDATEVRVPAAFVSAGAALARPAFKLEVLGIEDTGNKTIVEQVFEVLRP